MSLQWQRFVARGTPTLLQDSGTPRKEVTDPGQQTTVSLRLNFLTSEVQGGSDPWNSESRALSLRLSGSVSQRRSGQPSGPGWLLWASGGKMRRSVPQEGLRATRPCQPRRKSGLWLGHLGEADTEFWGFPSSGRQTPACLPGPGLCHVSCPEQVRRALAVSFAQVLRACSDPCRVPEGGSQHRDGAYLCPWLWRSLGRKLCVTVLSLWWGLGLCFNKQGCFCLNYNS